MQCPICKKRGISKKGYYSGGIQNHIDEKDYYQEDFYYCDLGHKWGIAQEPNKRKKTIIIKDTKGDKLLTTQKEYEEWEKLERKCID